MLEAMANDENIRPNEINGPSDNDRARFGFKKRISPRIGEPLTPQRETAPAAVMPAHVLTPKSPRSVAAVAPKAHHGGCAPGNGAAAASDAVGSDVGGGAALAVDLLALCDSELGDLEAPLALLRIKPRAGRYDFKDQIEELKLIVKPLKEALGDRLKRETSLRDAVEVHQAAIERHLSGVDEKIAQQCRLLADKFARERDVHNKEVRSLRTQVLDTERAWQQKELVQERAVAARDRDTEQLHKDALANLTQRLQESKEDCKRQLHEASQLLQSQIAESKRLTQEIQDTAQKKESRLSAEWAAKLEDAALQAKQREPKLRSDSEHHASAAAQREQDTKEEHAAALAALKSEHTASLEAMVADARKTEDELKSELEQQAVRAQVQRDDTLGAHVRELEQLKAQHVRREADLQAELEQTTAAAQCQERQLQAEHASKLAEVEAKAQQRERELSADAARRLSLAELNVQQRVQELTAKLEQQTSQSQQSAAEFRMELEAAASAARSREEELRAELKATVFKSRQLDDDLSSTRERFDLQEHRLQHEILEAGNRIRRLEGELASERSIRDRESIAKATLQGEHTTLQGVVAEQRTTLQAAQARLAASQERAAELQQELRGSEAEAERLRDAVAEEQARLQKQQEELDTSAAQLAATRVELATCSMELAALRDKSRRLSVGKRELELEFHSYKEHNSTSNQAQMQAITELKVTVDKLTQKVDTAQLELGMKSGDIALHQQSIKRLEDQLALAEGSRRELHNMIQELRGNIRVLCRVRPGPQDAASTLVQADDNKLALTHGAESYSFSFDRVFGPSSVQEDLFNEVSGLVQSALDGYKVCIFAYGQTGSGKTFTMQGGCEPSSWGLIPRSLRQIFRASEEMRLKGWQWTLRASFMEVYNEVIRDLLREEGGTGGARGSGSSTPQCHTIKHDADWGMMVTNMTCVQVSSIDHINSLTARAAKLRAVGSTDMNSMSSRSHSIFALYLSGSCPELNTELRGALHLVDLAGSERLDRSGAVGDRLKETQNINRSLSSLADVFLAKAEGRAHVPFRNSKLTHLMEPCLSGQGKTLMAVNVGPEAGNSHETLCSLRFASQVSQCTTGGKPKRSAKTLGKAASAAVLPTAATNRRGGC